MHFSAAPKLGLNQMPKFDISERLKIARRDLFEGEETDFTPWLSKNLHRLNDVLGFDLELIDTEARAGSRECDILARDANTGELVAIENQYGKSDPSHAWRLLEYWTLLDCTSCVLIAESIHDGTLATYRKLNSLGMQCFLIEFSCFRSGEAVTVDFDVKLRPSEFECLSAAKKAAIRNIDGRPKFDLSLGDDSIPSTAAGSILKNTAILLGRNPSTSDIVNELKNLSIKVGSNHLPFAIEAEVREQYTKPSGKNIYTAPQTINGESLAFLNAFGYNNVDRLVQILKKGLSSTYNFNIVKAS
jgi:hypothetical protein